MASKTYTLYDLSEIDYVPPGREALVIAKKSVNENSSRFFLRVLFGSFIDIKRTSRFELNKNNVEFVEVKEKVYNDYIDVVNGRSNMSLKSLERSV